MHDLNLEPIDFEFDSKKVVDSFCASKHDIAEFGAIITYCKSIFHFIIETIVSSLCVDKQIKLYIH